MRITNVCKKGLVSTFLFCVVFCLAAIAPAWGQKYSYQPPVQTFGQFSPARPMASYNCSQSQVNANTQMLQFFGVGGQLNGIVDCTGSIIPSARPTLLVRAALHEFNHTSTLTAVQISGANVVYVGTFPNCPTGNELLGEWGTIAGFTHSQNNVYGGPVLACTPTTITFKNNNGAIAETHAATWANKGFQLMGSIANGAFDQIIIPTRVSVWAISSAFYTLGNADNVFSFFYAKAPDTDPWSATTTIALNGFLTVSGSKMMTTQNIFAFASPMDAPIDKPILIEVTGTTPGITGGGVGDIVQINTEYTQFSSIFVD